MSYQERIRPGEVNMSDSIRGCLPTIDVLKQDYADMTNGLADPTDRAQEALHLSEAYAQASDHDFIGQNSEVLAQDLVAALFIESVNVVAYQELADAVRPKSGYSYGTADPQFFNLISRKLEARKRLMDHLDGYAETFEAADEEMLYNGLESIMYEAKCLINNTVDLDSKSEHEVGASLVGLLAEYKIVSALRLSGWPLTRYSSVSNDMEFGVDVEIPLGSWNHLQSLPIAVQAKKGGDTSLDINVNRYGIVVIKVPMNKKYGKRLTLTAEQSKQLSRAVRRILAAQATA